MNIVKVLRERIRAVIAAIVGAIFFCICGSLLTFVIAPGQALEANRIGNLPEMDAAYVAAAEAGDDILVSGRLEDNPFVDEGGFVSYELAEWQVTPADPEDENPQARGSWVIVETVAPDLNLNLEGGTLLILASPSVNFSGQLHDEMILGDGPEEAEDNGELLAEGSLRVEGFFDGDLVTVLGTKASTGGIIPEDLFGGDRQAFEQGEVDAARGLLFAGICFMVFAPIVLVGGILAAVFGRRRRL
jgi:hypothetical protein